MITKKINEISNDNISSPETLSQNNTSSITRKNTFSRKQKGIVGILIVIILVLGALYYQTHYSKAAVQKRAQAETIQLVKEVKKILVLPETDVPAVFDIQDPVLLINQQAFFVGAEKGDKLLVYPQIGKAIIYSPKRKMIVNVGPVTFNDSVKSIEKNQ